jgi:hypothetical protein
MAILETVVTIFNTSLFFMPNTPPIFKSEAKGPLMERALGGGINFEIGKIHLPYYAPEGRI